VGGLLSADAARALDESVVFDVPSSKSPTTLSPNKNNTASNNTSGSSKLDALFSSPKYYSNSSSDSITSTNKSLSSLSNRVNITAVLGIIFLKSNSYR
jgi:hypothetical protein